MAQLHYYQHRDGGAIHGFTLPLVADLAEQVRKGLLVPVDAPPEPLTVELPQALVDEVLAEESKLSKRKERERLLAELAALGDDEDDQDGDPVPDEPNERVRAAARRLPEVVASAGPAVGEVDEPFAPELPSPEHPKADGLSGGGTTRRRGGKQP